jgi:hypothetical protein
LLVAGVATAGAACALAEAEAEPLDLNKTSANASRVVDVSDADVVMNAGTRFGGADHNADFSEMSIFSGRANVPLAKEIAARLGVTLGDMKVQQFADGEVGIRVLDNVRGKDVYLIQPTCPPGVNDNLMELILMVSTMRRASAATITASG